MRKGSVGNVKHALIHRTSDELLVARSLDCLANALIVVRVVDLRAERVEGLNRRFVDTRLHLDRGKNNRQTVRKARLPTGGPST